ncbi:MAG: S-layer homology domain-containing protein [Acidimicrobiia bacterium]|nr:S-layer homology domain-containing protein [Acidimicrobiia bacterium]
MDMIWGNLAPSGNRRRGASPRPIAAAVVLALLGALCAGSAAAADPPATITAFADESIDDPRMLVVGPDDALWFPNRGGHSVGRISLEGDVSSFPVESDSAPNWLAANADRVWFGTATDAVGWVTPAGTVEVFTDASISEPRGITAGADDDLWFVSGETDTIVRVTAAGVVTTISDPQIETITDIELGPDGNLWVTAVEGGRVGRITPQGDVTIFSSTMTIPTSIASGPDGNLWLTGFGSRWSSDGIVRMTPDGSTVRFTDAAVWTTLDILAGPDDALWFRTEGFFQGCFPSCPPPGVGRITTDGEITVFTGHGLGEARGLTVGPDENLWFTTTGSESIGRLTPSGAVASYQNDLIVSPYGLTAAPDGNLWFLDTDDRIIRMAPVDPPGAPTDVTGVALDRAAEVSWNAPASDGGSPITSYTATAAPGGATCTTDGHLTCTIGGLTNGETYTVTVTATNAVTSGPPSAPSAPVELPLLAPQAPHGVQAVAGNAEVTVTWAAPDSDGGSPITSYTATAAPGGATCTTDGALTCTIGGLTNGETYTVTVTATNAVGTGAPSPPSPAVTPVASSCEAGGSGPFVDVGPTHPFCVEIEWLAAMGIATGFPDDTFRPVLDVSRQAIAAFLWRYEGEPDPPEDAPQFSDVPESQPFFAPISWLAADGIATGYDDGTFRPTNPVSRQAAAAFLWRLAGEPDPPEDAPQFSDVPESHPFFAPISWLAADGIATGYDDGTFRPTSVVTRQAIAAFLFRYNDLTPAPS